MLSVKRLNLAVIMLLIVCSSYLVLASFQTGAQTEYSIDFKGYTWNHSTISVSVIPQENATWWEPSYLNASLHGIGQWNDAIQEFASNHADFSYLSHVSLVPTISYEVVSGFDIYIEWNCECESEALIGQSQATVQSSCIITNSRVSLTAKAPSGHVMTEVDMQNIVVHEIGHTLGMSHSNNSKDAMYATIEYRDTVKPVSSLDMYALSQIFKWITNSTQFSSTSMCPEGSVFILPPSINYVHYNINAENLPVSSPQNVIEDVLGLFLRPEIIVIIIVIVTPIVVIAMILKKRKKPQ